MTDFDAKYPNARASTGKPGWPPDVRSISQDGLDYIGVDSAGALYWDGRPIKVGSRIELTALQAIGAVIGIVSAASLAIFDALRFFGYGSISPP
jgi:hypothetical protein